MRQQDYSTIAPRGQVPPQQYPQQPGYVQQPGYPPQPGYVQQPPPGYVQPPVYVQQPGYVQQQPPPQPQPGYAPNGYFIPQSAMDGLEYSTEFKNAYQKNLDAFNEANRKVKEGVNQSEAVQLVKKMSAYKTKVDATLKEMGCVSNISQLLALLDDLCVSMEHPEAWLPAYREKYVEPMRTQSAPIVAALRKTASTIKKLAAPSNGTAPANAAGG